MKKTLIILIFSLVLTQTKTKCDEGMWLPLLIEQFNMETMKEMGLQLTAEEIYSINNSSIKDAVVSFNGYCTGEIISDKGLLLTNHHCGYDAIQNLSSVDNDYLGNGFWAKSNKEEIPNEDLFVDFLIKMEDVSQKILDSISYSTPEDVREKLIGERITKMKEEATNDNHYWAEIKPFFGGGEYYLFLYERYNDVRLVGTPPESIGKFGGDTDNWMWPRHTGDFALFRVYTSPDGKPAEYSVDNVPLKPKHHLPISLDGVKEGDFTMVMGYPGGTDRYLSSFGVKSAISLYNPNVVKVREEKLNILNKHMASDRAIDIMYASKKARVSNYWKYYIGQTKGLKRLRVFEKKQDLEKKFNDFVNLSEENELIYGSILGNMKLAQKELDKTTLPRIYLNEAAWGGANFIKLARRSERLIKALDSGVDSLIDVGVLNFKKEVENSFKEYSKKVDLEIFVKMMEMYVQNVPAEQLPDIINKMQKKYKGDFEKWGKVMYSKSIFVDKDKMLSFLEKPSKKIIIKDPCYIVQKSILDNYFTNIVPQRTVPQKSIQIAERLFIDGLKKMMPNKVFYPNANFTMRLSYGSVGEYQPRNAVLYDYVTTLDGVMEKMDNDNPEFVVPQKIVELYNAQDYGPYANENGELNICFISNNDITGGNSGSPVINKHGHLIGCAFDGNWEAMSGDIAFEHELQRTISVDARYIVFVIDKFAGASNIIDELTLIKAN